MKAASASQKRSGMKPGKSDPGRASASSGSSNKASFATQTALMFSSGSPLHPRLPNSSILGHAWAKTLAHSAYDGAPLSGLYGADVFIGLRDAGYSMFRDGDRLDPSHFVTGDIFSDVDDPARTRGTLDIIHLAMFLHIFARPEQEAASRNIMELLKAVPGSTVVGTQTGPLIARKFVLQPPFCNPGEHKTIYRHSKESMKDIFEEAAEAVGLKVDKWAEYDEDEAQARVERRKQNGEEREKKEIFFAGPNERRILFRVEVIRVHKTIVG